MTVSATLTGPDGGFRAGLAGSATLAIRVAFTRIDAGTMHTCGIARGGSVYCWGSGAWGMLGDGADGQAMPPHLSTTPVTVGSGHVVDVAVGAMNSCALDASGVVYCAGANNQKQLGVDTAPAVCNEPLFPQYSENCSNTFIQVSGTTTFSRIFASGYTTCGLTSTGDTYCWGQNLAALSNYSLPAALATPTLVSPTVKLTQLTGGASHMCGLAPDGTAYCWGRGGFGELGTGQQVPADAPTAVASALTFTRIAAGGSHTCAVSTSGDVYCWGSNTKVELGSHTSESCNGAATYSIVCSTTPVQVPNLPKAIDVAAGYQHSCALTTSGAVYCWGAGGSGQLGDGSIADFDHPVRMKDTK